MWCGTTWCSKLFARTKITTWRIRSAAAERASPGMGNRRQQPRVRQKKRVEKTSKHDFEPAERRAAGAKAAGSVFEACTKRVGSDGSRGYDLLCERSRDRGNE